MTTSQLTVLPATEVSALHSSQLVSDPVERNHVACNCGLVVDTLAAHPDQAFTQSEIRDATDVKAGSISVVLSRLEDRGLVRHKGNYWALGEVDDVVAYASMLESTRTATDRFDDEDMDEWLEHAVDDEDKATE